MTALALRRDAVALLESIGWTVRAAEIDLVAGSARIRVMRHDGLRVTLDARAARCLVMREVTDRYVVTVGRRGDRIPVERVDMRLIGIDRFTGFRAGLRFLADYLDDNGSAPALDSGRGAMRLLMAGGL